MVAQVDENVTSHFRIRDRAGKVSQQIQFRPMPEPRRKTRNEHSSGGAVISFRDGRPHVAMIATRNRTRWGSPKGAVSKGETSEQAALREVQEETGILADIVTALDTIEY